MPKSAKITQPKLTPITVTRVKQIYLFVRHLGCILFSPALCIVKNDLILGINSKTTAHVYARTNISNSKWFYKHIPLDRKKKIQVNVSLLLQIVRYFQLDPNDLFSLYRLASISNLVKNIPNVILRYFLYYWKQINLLTFTIQLLRFGNFSVGKCWCRSVLRPIFMRVIHP